MLIPNSKLITKMIVSAAILGSCVVGTTPARADTDPSDQPNPFSALGCGCQEPALADGSLPTAALERGIRDGAR